MYNFLNNIIFLKKFIAISIIMTVYHPCDTKAF